MKKVKFTSHVVFLMTLSIAFVSVKAVTVNDINQASPFLFQDLLSFNWRILEQQLGIPVPSTPTGTNVSFLRMFSNGNSSTAPPDLAAGLPDAISWPSVGQSGGLVNVFTFDSSGQPLSGAAQIYGLQFDDNSALIETTTVGELTGFLQTVSGSGPSDPISPIFAFDQNQTGAAPDIFLRGRLFLLDPFALDPSGDPVAAGMEPGAINTVINSIVDTGSSEIRTFKFLDDPLNIPNFSEDDPLLPNDDDQWVLLPGLFDPDGPLTTFEPVNNNGAGNEPDWGGYLLDGGFPMNLRSVKADDGTTDVEDDWLFMLELHALGDNNGKEEAYLLTVLDQAPLSEIPEPLTLWTGLASLVAVGFSLQRRYA